MTLRGIVDVAAVECTKLRAQAKVQLVIAAAAIGPFAFAAALRLQSAVPSDTLFGREVLDSGFAVPLVILGFAAMWVLPALASVVAGDLFSSEDRYGTWTMILTRSRTRGEIFAGKTVTALLFAIGAVVLLALSSAAAGVLVIGRQPLIDLSGAELPAHAAAARVAAAWLSVLLPTCALTAVALLVSIATRSSAAGVGVPVVAALGMQLVALVDGPETARQLLVTTAFGAWHGLLTDAPFYRPLMSGTIVAAVYTIACLGTAYSLLRARDIGR